MDRMYTEPGPRVLYANPLPSSHTASGFQGERPGAPVPARVPGQIEEQLVQLELLLGRLHDAISSLDDRLRYVIRSESQGNNAATTAGSPQSVLVPLACTLRDANSRIDHAVARLAVLLVSIEL